MKIQEMLNKFKEGEFAFTHNIIINGKKVSLLINSKDNTIRFSKDTEYKIINTDEKKI